MCYELSRYMLYHLNEGGVNAFRGAHRRRQPHRSGNENRFPERRQFAGACAPKLLGIAVNIDGSANEEHRDEQRTVPIGNVSGGRKVRGEKGRLPIGRSLPSCPTRRRIPRQGRLRNLDCQLL